MSLIVGEVRISVKHEEVSHELVAVFHDDMIHCRPLGGTPLEQVQLRAAGKVVADRLDVMGIDAASILADLDEMLETKAEGLINGKFFAWSIDEHQRKVSEGQRIQGMTGRDWARRLASAVNPDSSLDKNPDDQRWLLGLISEWETRRRLRAVLLAIPDAEVVLEIPFDPDYPWLGVDQKIIASESQKKMYQTAATHVPAIVLTEGKTDAEFLRDSLEVLYPHLTDLVRFMDYEQRPEAGIGALMRGVRAFAAAGIANRVIAIFDNDTAAVNELRKLDELRELGRIRLPEHICVMKYPDLDFARNYPTLGPPTVNHPHGSPEQADINGLAASIELYLGRDVLMAEDGSLRPVQWKAFILEMNNYQGVVTGKREIQESFRAKVSIAKRSPETIKDQDWKGLSLILGGIFAQLGKPIVSAASN